MRANSVLSHRPSVSQDLSLETIQGSPLVTSNLAGSEEGIYWTNEGAASEIKNTGGPRGSQVQIPESANFPPAKPLSKTPYTPFFAAF